MKRKCLAIGIILLFVGTCIIPAIAQDDGKPILASRGNWLYVGGSGPGNYSKIQDAINASSPGDTVYVYSGKYAEHLVINIQNFILRGEGKETTFLGFDWSDRHIVDIFQNSVTISGFSIKAGSVRVSPVHLNLEVSNITITNNSLRDGLSGVHCDGQNRDLVFNDNAFTGNRCSINTRNHQGTASHFIFRRNVFYGGLTGIGLTGDQCEATNNSFFDVGTGIDQASSQAVITDNFFYESSVGISIYGTTTMITRNSFSTNGYGISLQGGDVYIADCQFEEDSTGISLLLNNNALIERCSFIKESSGIYLQSSTDIEINACNFTKNSRGVYLRSSDAVITSCNFSSNKVGLNIDYSCANITRNNFMNDNIVFTLTSTGKRFVRLFDNYYSRQRLLRVKIIPGTLQTIIFIPFPYYDGRYLYRLGFVIDWHPAQEPYDFGV
jgi:nitrous oxidase accessory protein NosD